MMGWHGMCCAGPEMMLCWIFLVMVCMALLPNVPKACFLYYIQISHCGIRYYTLAISLAIELLIIISRRIPEPIDDTPLPLRGSGKVVARYIGIIIVIVIAVPLRSFALPFTLRVRLLSGSGAADGFWLLGGCWWSKMFVRCRSWNSGCRGNMWRLWGVGGTFKRMSYTLVVLEFFGAVGKEILASPRVFYENRILTLRYQPVLCWQQ